MSDRSTIAIRIGAELQKRVMLVKSIADRLRATDEWKRWDRAQSLVAFAEMTTKLKPSGRRTMGTYPEPMALKIVSKY